MAQARKVKAVKAWITGVLFVATFPLWALLLLVWLLLIVVPMVIGGDLLQWASRQR